MIRRVLVTGASGFVGASLVPALGRLLPGWSVRALVRESAEQTFPAGVELARGDLRENESVRRALRDVGAVVHAAALLTGDAATLREVNVEGTRRLASAARAAGVEQLVLVSSGGVYGAPTLGPPRTEETPVAPHTPYAQSKYAAEEAARRAFEGARLTVLRPTGVYGPGRDLYVRILERLRRSHFAVRLAGDEVLHPCHVDDLVRAIGCVLHDPPIGTEVFNIAGERVIRLEELHAWLCRLAGGRRHCFALPRGLGIAAVRVLARVRWREPAELETQLEKARGLFPSGALSTERFEARYRIAWTPLEVGLREMVESWQRAAGVRPPESRSR